MAIGGCVRENKTNGTQNECTATLPARWQSWLLHQSSDRMIPGVPIFSRKIVKISRIFSVAFFRRDTGGVVLAIAANFLAVAGIALFNGNDFSVAVKPKYGGNFSVVSAIAGNLSAVAGTALFGDINFDGDGNTKKWR
ncbi:unnamed protein product [Pylaiella littoralis]